jgi:hypothetical protein
MESILLLGECENNNKNRDKRDYLLSIVCHAELFIKWFGLARLIAPKGMSTAEYL